MRTHLVGIVMAAIALSACREDRRELLAPRAPNFAGFPFPRPVQNPDDFVEIVAGDFHTCARKGNGNVYCWGQANGPRFVTPVVQVPTLAGSGAVQLAAGASHT